MGICGFFILEFVDNDLKFLNFDNSRLIDSAFTPNVFFNANFNKSETVFNTMEKATAPNKKLGEVVGINKTQRNRDRKNRYKAKHKIMGRVIRTVEEVKDVGAINLSEKTVSDDMVLLLAKGPSFSPTTSHVNWKQFFLDFESFVNRLRRKEIFYQNSILNEKGDGRASNTISNSNNKTDSVVVPWTPKSSFVPPK